MNLYEENFDTSAESSVSDSLISIKNKKVKKPIELNLTLIYENTIYDDDRVDFNYDMEKIDEVKIQNKNLIKNIEKLEEINEKENQLSAKLPYQILRNKDNRILNKIIVKKKKGENFRQKVRFSTEQKLQRAKEIEVEIRELFTSNKTSKILPKREELFNNFAEIGIFLKFSDLSEFNTKRTKIGKRAKSFFIDLVREKDYYYIKMFLGKNTKISVTDIRTDINQLILHVREPSRTFEIKKYEWDSINKKSKVLTETLTTRENSYFLIGEDEGNPFMSLLANKVITVDEAHESLKPDKIKRMKSNEFKRQGEWFFVETSNVYHKLAVKNRQGISNGKGRKHKVSKLINLGDDDNKEYVIKGYVSHPDHSNIKFSRWTRVYENKELVLSSQIRGVSWFD